MMGADAIAKPPEATVTDAARPSTPDPRPDAGSDYRVELDVYSGPLDLLLYLVKRHEVDLLDLPIAKMTEQYLAHLDLLRQREAGFDVNLAGEFLVMAATLLEIKSQMLAPRPEGEQGPGDAGEATDALNPLDPRYELVQQLLAYKRFKDAAGELDGRMHDWSRRFAAMPKKADAGDEQAAEVEIELEDADVLTLCAAFARVLDSIGQNRQHEVTYDDTPIELHAEDILDRLRREASSAPGGMSLRTLFEGRKTRSELIGLFLATLELVKQRHVKVTTDPAGDPAGIKLVLMSEEQRAALLAAEDAPHDRPADDYDWPDPQAKERAEARARRRANRLARIRAGEAVEEDDEDEAIDIEPVDAIDQALRGITDDGRVVKAEERGEPGEPPAG